MSEPDEIQQLLKLLEPRLAGDQTDLYRRALEQFDRIILRRALEHCEGNLTRAAALLGLSRVTLRSKLRSLGLLGGKNSASDPGGGNPKSANANHPPVVTHPPVEHPPQGHPHSPQSPNAPREAGQDLTRPDMPGAGPSAAHFATTGRRESAGFYNAQFPK